MMRLIDADALEIDMVIEEAETPLMPWYPSHMPMRKTLGVSIEQIDNAPTIDAAPKWIPCEERLPKEYGLYLTTMNDGFVQECSYVPTDYGDVLLNGWCTCEASGFKVLNENDVLAWMPLPEPYKRGEEDERV